MQLKETEKALEAFKNYVLNQSRSMLSKKGKNVSNKLFKSLDGIVKEMPNSISVKFEMEEYGYYQDKGVKGKTSTYPEIAKYGTLAKFGSGKGKKGGLTKGIDKWVKAKRFQFRDKETGKFLSYKSTAFLIRRSIWNKGIKPSLFFTKPFENAFKQLPDELVEKFGLDVEDFLAFTLKKDKA
tara:strand:+ start:8071 stop:8616 length:546 start_codon:yes stop_codon:yes gene_type:complete